MSFEDLPRAEFAFPGPLRDRLLTAILSGSKTATTSLAVEYERADEPFPRVGERSVVVDSSDQPVAVIELTDVRVLCLADVDTQHAVDEGEGHESVADWRVDHERFWHSTEIRCELGDPTFTVHDGTRIVATRFRLVDRI